MKNMNNKRNFMTHLVAALATMSSIATLVTFSFGWQIKPDTYIGIPISVGLFILVVPLVYAYYQTREKKKIQLKLSANLNLIIQQADLLEQKGIIVIPVNEFFDTNVEVGIIGPMTLPGKFIKKYYKDHLIDLDNDIKASLQKQNITPVETNCKRWYTAGKTDKYELGTCALVQNGGKEFVLVAYTHLDDNDNACLNRDEYGKVLGKLIKFVSKIANHNEVHMPVLGSCFSLNRSESRILYFIIDSLDFLYPRPFMRGIYIDIRSLSSANVSLNAIEDHFKNGIKGEI